MLADEWYLIASALSADLATVPDIGVIHVAMDYPQLEDSLRVFLSESPEADDINAWLISRAAVTQSREQTPPQQWNRIHEFVIRGYYSVSTDSYSRFQSLIDDVLDLFSPPKRLDFLNTAIEDIIEAPQVGYRRMGEGLPLVHYVQMPLPVKQLKTER